MKRLMISLIVLVASMACEDPIVVTPNATLNVRRPGPELVEIKFRESLRIRADAQGRLRSDRGASLVAIQAVLDRHTDRVRPLISVPDGLLAALVERARLTSNEEPPDMLSWHHVMLRPGADVETALLELQAQPEVEYAYLAPEPAPPPTPDFTGAQAAYFGAAPSGTEEVYARSLAGGRGGGVMVIDLEYDWHFGHEDLGLSPSILITGDRHGEHGTDHGTATLGILVGRDNGFGITGGVPDATIRVASPMYGGVYKPADAIMNAASAMVAGDVLLIEQQAKGPAADTGYIPLEWVTSVYNAIRTATLAGIVVIEPAGNGFRNLDASVYGGRFDRNQFDSRAIIVGGGDNTNARWPSSTYGSRVDVQAHGLSVTSTGYGDLFGSSANDNYTATFYGTSSASAIVAAAAATLQGYQKHRNRPALSPQAMTTLLKSTGSPQTGNTAQPIGPKPNLREAIARLDGPPLSVQIEGADSTRRGGVCLYTAYVQGGVEPYTYYWWSSRNPNNEDQAEYFVWPGGGSGDYITPRVEVTDAIGNTVLSDWFNTYGIDDYPVDEDYCSCEPPWCA